MPDTDTQQAAEEKIADMIFGPEETEQPVEEPEEEYQPDPKPVVEGDEAEPEEVEAVEPEGDPIVEFEWNGALIEAPTSIKEALMRNSDYTQKTQTLSADRKAFEVTQGEVTQRMAQIEFAESIQPDILKAQQLEAQANQIHEYMRANIDDLSAVDIEKARLAIEDARRERDELVQSLTGKQQEHQQAQEQAREELLKKGTEVLKSRIPGWNEDTQKAIRGYALQSGYTEAEIASLVDPRQVETLWKASQYDSLQQGKAAAVKKVQQAPSIKAKSRNPMPKEVGDKLNLRKKLKSKKISNADKANLLGDNIAKRFGM